MEHNRERNTRFKRKEYDMLRCWYEDGDGRVLWLSGAPAVGKSRLINLMCEEYKINYVYVSAFQSDLKVQVKRLKTEKIEPELLIIDGINDKSRIEFARKLILKIRCDELLPDIRIVIEGRLMWTEDNGIPGEYEKYVKPVQIFPMSFTEFYETVSDKYTDEKKDYIWAYMVTGGLPECVDCFMRTGNLSEIRGIQQKIYNTVYGQCTEKEKVVLRTVVEQLVVDNAGFAYSYSRRNIREREYGAALNDLESKGIIYRIDRFKEDAESAEMRDYKIYLYDVGLTGSILNISEKMLMSREQHRISDSEILIKTYMTQLYHRHKRVNGWKLYYWHKARAKARLPLIIECTDKKVMIPIQLDFGKNYARSICSFLGSRKEKLVYRVQECVCDYERAGSLKEYLCEDTMLYNIDTIYDDAKKFIKKVYKE